MCFTSPFPSPTPPAPQIEEAVPVQEWVLPLEEVFVWQLHRLTQLSVLIWKEIATPWAGTYVAWDLWGIWIFSGALQSSNGLAWCHLACLFGWDFLTLWICSVRRSGKHQLKVSSCSPCSWSFSVKEKAGKSCASQSYCTCSFVCFLTMPVLKD